MKEVLSQKNVNFVYMDISSGMLPLKNFLKIRDFSESHKEAREKGRVGIPALAVDGVAYTLAGTESAEQLIKELNLV